MCIRDSCCPECPCHYLPASWNGHGYRACYHYPGSCSAASLPETGSSVSYTHLSWSSKIHEAFFKEMGITGSYELIEVPQEMCIRDRGVDAPHRVRTLHPHRMPIRFIVPIDILREPDDVTLVRF